MRLALLLCLLAASTAIAAPQVRTSQECYTLADMALVARSAAAENVPVSTTAAMFKTIYLVTSPRLLELAALIIESAYRDKRTPGQFAMALAEQCVRTGNLDPFFGAPA